ncbi:hypothetical protein [Halomarina litorea]|uniref:hypothetical protein n=1 Tax=Halomarina litorea TaxID=2961595 RepID=UPI0020C1F36E|nr:hypothetical protein [Halomarina sp. BCD28]
MSRSDDIEFLGEHLRRKAGTAGLRTRMREFVDAHGGGDVKALRTATADDTSLADVVIEDRDERV